MKVIYMKSLYLNTLIQIFDYFKTSDGKSIIKSNFQTTEIANAISNGRQGYISSLDPYI